MLTLTIAALVATAIGAWYAFRQVAIVNERAAKQDQQEREIIEWQRKHESVALQLARINGLLQVQYPDKVNRYLYMTVFPDQQLRKAIELYIIQTNEIGAVFTPRKPSELELQSVALRDTVTQTTAILEQLRIDNPTVACHFGKP